MILNAPSKIFSLTILTFLKVLRVGIAEDWISIDKMVFFQSGLMILYLKIVPIRLNAMLISKQTKKIHCLLWCVTLCLVVSDKKKGRQYMYKDRKKWWSLSGEDLCCNRWAKRNAHHMDIYWKKKRIGNKKKKIKEASAKKKR